MAAAIALLVLRNAAAASFRFRAAPGELRIRRLTGERVVPIAEVAAVEPLMHGPERTGAVIRLRNGAREAVDWTGLLDAETVVEKWRAASRSSGESEAPSQKCVLNCTSSPFMRAPISAMYR